MIKRIIPINSYGFRPKNSEINSKNSIFREKKISRKFLLSSATFCSKFSGFALTVLRGSKNPLVQGFKTSYGRNLQKKLFSCEKFRSPAPPNVRKFSIFSSLNRTAPKTPPIQGFKSKFCENLKKSILKIFAL